MRKKESKEAVKKRTASVQRVLTRLLNCEMSLVDELGFDPVDAGSLEQSLRQQPGTREGCLVSTQVQQIGGSVRRVRQCNSRLRAVSFKFEDGQSYY